MVAEAYKQKSEENWSAGVDCLRANWFNAAANRFYYALFQAAVYWGYVALNKKLQQSDVGVHRVYLDLLKDRYGPRGKDYSEIVEKFKRMRTCADYRRESVKASQLEREILQQGNLVRTELLRSKGVSK